MDYKQITSQTSRQLRPRPQSALQISCFPQRQQTSRGRLKSLRKDYYMLDEKVEQSEKGTDYNTSDQENNFKTERPIQMQTSSSNNQRTSVIPTKIARRHIPSSLKIRTTSWSSPAVQQTDRSTNFEVKSKSIDKNTSQESIRLTNIHTKPILSDVIQDNSNLSSNKQISSNKLHSLKDLRYDQITPEVAAQIVRHYLLPMIANKTQARKNSQGGSHELQVLVEISEKLQVTKVQLQNEIESRQLFQAQNTKMQRELRSLNSKQNLAKKELKNLRMHLSERNKQFGELKEKWDIMNYNMQFSFDYALSADKKCKKYMNQVFVQQQQIQHQQNEAIVNNTATEIQKSENLYMKLKYSHLIASMDNTHSSFQLGQVYRQQISQLQFEKQQQSLLINELQVTVADLTTEKNQFRGEVSYLTEAYNRMTRIKETLFKKFNEQIEQLNQQLTSLQIMHDKKFDKLIKLDTKFKQVVKERDQLKLKNIVLINTRKSAQARGEVETKTCKHCNQDFNEKENFNWSCRIHISDWGGQVWWCCGKTDKNQPGCKFSKHQTKDDENNFQNEDQEENETKLSRLRCNCCKQLGHSTQKCTKDPNFKTVTDLDADEERLLNSSVSDRRLHMDTIVNTTHFLKKVVTIPLYGVPPRSRSVCQPFKRGIMSFDDFNYKAFNPVVLVNEPQDSNMKIADLESRMNTKKTQIVQNNSLTERELKLVSDTTEVYKQDAITIEPGKFETLQIGKKVTTIDMQQLLMEDESDLKEQNLNKKIDDKRAEEIQKQFNVNMYFKEDEIEQIKNTQQVDIFQEILELKRQAILSIDKNAIKIEIPKDNILTQMSDQVKKKKRVRLVEPEQCDSPEFSESSSQSCLSSSINLSDELQVKELTEKQKQFLEINELEENIKKMIKSQVSQTKQQPLKAQEPLQKTEQEYVYTERDKELIKKTIKNIKPQQE